MDIDRRNKRIQKKKKKEDRERREREEEKNRYKGAVAVARSVIFELQHRSTLVIEERILE